MVPVSARTPAGKGGAQARERADLRPVLPVGAGTLREAQRNHAWLRPLVVGLSLFLAFSGGSWALMHWLSVSIQSRIGTLAMLEVRIDQARDTLAEIEETSWGVTLREIDGERFVVLPDGTRDDPPWTVRGRPALKLSSE